MISLVVMIGIILGLVLIGTVGFIFSKWEGNGNFGAYCGVLSTFFSIICIIIIFTYYSDNWKNINIEKIKTTIIKTDSRVYVEYDLTEYGYNDIDVILFDKNTDYNLINDSTTFYILKGINHFDNEFEYKIGYGKFLDIFYEKNSNNTIKTPDYIKKKYNNYE